jgi:hypothetical protein
MCGRRSVSRAGHLAASGLIKLRDLSDNCWNADTLYILSPSASAARRLARLIEDEEWCGMTQIHTDQEEVDAALGSGKEERAIVSVWWD